MNFKKGSVGMITRTRKEDVRKTAKLLAGRFRMKCSGQTCETCDRDCMWQEYAQLVLALGYNKNKAHVHKNVMRSAEYKGLVGELAKSLAFCKGYGCNDDDCCVRCVIGGDCIPHDVAYHLIQHGYRKEGNK